MRRVTDNLIFQSHSHPPPHSPIETGSGLRFNHSLHSSLNHYFVHALLAYKYHLVVSATCFGGAYDFFGYVGLSMERIETAGFWG